MERTRLPGSAFSAVIFLAAVAVTLSHYARALPAVQTVVSRSNSDEYATNDDTMDNCFQLVIEGTDCQENDMSLDDIADYSEVFVEVIINDNMQYNDSLEKYCRASPVDRSDRSASLDFQTSYQNSCPNIPFVLENPRGCGVAASLIAGERFTVRFYDPESDDDDLLCSSNISDETIYNITKSTYHMLQLCLLSVNQVRVCNLILIHSHFASTSV